MRARLRAFTFLPAISVFCLLGAAVALSSCGDGPLADPVPVSFEIPRDAFPEFLEAPWPSDVLRTTGEDGAPRLILRPFPNPFDSALLDEYLQLFQGEGAYPSSGGLYFHVSEGVDAASLPATPQASTRADASLFLVPLEDPSERIPVEWKLYEEGNSFVPPGTVAVFPLLGAVPRGRAALVVTADARSADGAPLGPDDDLDRLMRCEPIEGAAVEVDCAEYEELATALGRPLEEIALLQIVTYLDSASALERAAETARELGPPVVTHDGLSDDEADLYQVYEGSVGLAQFQAGTPPFHTFDGTTGGFVWNEDGEPEVQRIEDVRFVLTVPRGEPPPDGWPIVIMGHGTGGSLSTGLGNGPSAESHQLARAGWAMLTTSEPLHRTREGFSEGSEEILTFNFLNPVGGRDIWRQSALEKVQLISAVQALDLDASLTGGRGGITFDEERVGYFGHSQGGIVGALFVGVEDRLSGAFLSGAGAGFAPSLIEKEEPVEIGQVVRTLLNLPPEEPLDRFHPLLTLLQIWVDPADPVNYGSLWRWREARRTPHLVVTSGLQDQYTPKRNHGGLAGAFGLPLVAPIAEPVAVLDLLGPAPAGEEAQGNLIDGDGHPLTGGLLQYPDDGHFAVYYNPDAQDAYRLFFESLLVDEPPRVRTVRVP